MRIEQLVVYGPGDDDRVRFGSGVTVFAGLGPQERVDLIETVVDALTGRLPNASVVYTDHESRKVFADRTGATYAVTGAAASAPSELLGKDPATVSALLTPPAADLGLGEQVPAGRLQADLATARAHLEGLRAAHADLAERNRLVSTWKAELADLTRRIDKADEDATRWAWVELRRRLDEVRAELNMVDQVHHGRTDRQILEAVDALRCTGEVWADLAAAASELRGELGALPAVAPDDLARVASTPAELPDDFSVRLHAWQAATDLHRVADAELAQCRAATPDPVDTLVATFAARDQVRLWEVHSQLEQATDTYQRMAETLNRIELDPEVEERIESAHLEVVRRQRDVERRFRPGMLGSATLAAGALLAVYSVSTIVGTVMLLASVAMATWLILVPRRNLAAANLVEGQALAGADAGSWLGLHLRRLDAVADLVDRKRFEATANARASAQVDWDEVAGPHGPDELTVRADAVRAYADATDPKSIARRLDEATAFSTAARSAETAARNSLTSGLEAYGLVLGGGADLDPQQLSTILGRRVQAGQVARRAKKLAVLEHREAEAARKLGDVLSYLGYDDGDLESRLERAIGAVAAARHRQAPGTRSRAAIEQEIAVLDQQTQATAQAGWADGADGAEPGGPPTDPDLLDGRRREIGELVAAVGRPDVMGAERRYDVGLARVNELETRLEELSHGPGSLQQRLISRLGRTAWMGEHGESVPVLVDEALVSVPVAERMDLLDLVVRLSDRVQVVLLSDDPVLTRWARDRSTHAEVTLYEAQAEPEAPQTTVAPDSVPLPVSVF